MSGDRARVSVTVAIPPARAFQIFTADIDRWWRRGLKFRHSASRSSLLCIEPKVGGRLFESFDSEGTQHIIEVGRVRVDRLVVGRTNELAALDLRRAALIAPERLPCR